MKLIPLTRGHFTKVDDEDYEFLIQWKWNAGIRKNTIYAVRNTGKPWKVILMHREILGVTDSKILVDHKDHNGLNNQRSNIRPCTHSQNAMNKKANKDSTSQFLGVSLYRNKKWQAVINIDRVKKHLGYYHTEESAAMIYNENAIKFHGEFASLNKL